MGVGEEVFGVGEMAAVGDIPGVVVPLGVDLALPGAVLPEGQLEVDVVGTGNIKEVVEATSIGEVVAVASMVALPGGRPLEAEAVGHSPEADPVDAVGGATFDPGSECLSSGICGWLGGGFKGSGDEGIVG